MTMEFASDADASTQLFVTTASPPLLTDKNRRERKKFIKPLDREGLLLLLSMKALFFSLSRPQERDPPLILMHTRPACLYRALKSGR